MRASLLAKLRVAELDGDSVPRPHSMQLLDPGLRRKVTDVAAPASFGKTTTKRRRIT